MESTVRQPELIQIAPSQEKLWIEILAINELNTTWACHQFVVGCHHSVIPIKQRRIQFLQGRAKSGADRNGSARRIFPKVIDRILIKLNVVAIAPHEGDIYFAGLNGNGPARRLGVALVWKT